MVEKKKKMIGQQIRTDKALYRQEFKMCGKPNCTRCPHGPYWYAIQYRKGHGKRGSKFSIGKTISTYIGKKFTFIPGDDGTCDLWRKRRSRKDEKKKRARAGKKKSMKKTVLPRDKKLKKRVLPVKTVKSS